MSSCITRSNLCGISEYSARKAGLLRDDHTVDIFEVVETESLEEDAIHEIDLWVA